MKKELIIILLSWATAAYGHVLIITHVYNRPDFIKVQDQTFKKFLKDEYEFVVFNDAPGAAMAEEIESMCKNLDLRCIRIPQEIHKQPYLPKIPNEDSNNPSKRSAHVLQYSLDVLGFDHDDLVVIIDSDMFLIREFSFRDYLNGYVLAGVPQYRNSDHYTIDYLWNGILVINMPSLPDKHDLNFNSGYVEDIRTDTGGYTHYYLRDHRSLPIKYIDIAYVTHRTCAACKRKKRLCKQNAQYLRSFSFSPDIIDIIQKGFDTSELYNNGTFFHYRSGTNWNNKSKKYHDAKTNYFNEFIKKIIS